MDLYQEHLIEPVRINGTIVSRVAFNRKPGITALELSELMALLKSVAAWDGMSFPLVARAEDGWELFIARRQVAEVQDELMELACAVHPRSDRLVILDLRRSVKGPSALGRTYRGGPDWAA